MFIVNIYLHKLANCPALATSAPITNAKRSIKSLIIIRL